MPLSCSATLPLRPRPRRLPSSFACHARHLLCCGAVGLWCMAQASEGESSIAVKPEGEEPEVASEPGPKAPREKKEKPKKEPKEAKPKQEPAADGAPGPHTACKCCYLPLPTVRCVCWPNGMHDVRAAHACIHRRPHDRMQYACMHAHRCRWQSDACAGFFSIRVGHPHV